MEDVAWFPLIFELANPSDKAQMAGPVLSNVDTEDFQVMYRLPLAGLKGNKRLHIDGAQLGVYYADPSNFVPRFHVNAISFNDVDALAKIEEPIQMKMMKTQMFPAVDVSHYESVFIRLWCTVAEPKKIAISSAMLHCYYV